MDFPYTIKENADLVNRTNLVHKFS